MKLNEVGEDEIVRRLTSGLKLDQRVILGPGDDCAVVKTAGNLQLLKSDCVIEGVHFASDADPVSVGWKAMCRSISDIASMGGLPADALITVAIPADAELDWLKKLYRGLRRAASVYRVNLVGGETAKSPGPIFLVVSLTGSITEGSYVTRAGGKKGDWLFVTGKLGGSIRGKHLRFSPRVKEAYWLAHNFPIHAMMDLSDGLGSDLPRLAAASGLGFDLAIENLPLNKGCTAQNALRDGEDYELLFALPQVAKDRLKMEWKKAFPRLQLTPIGRLVERGRNELGEKGYDHFRSAK
jgi:thiamine-monophosphate kinase